MTQKALFSQIRIRFAKVAEYQARGVVHFHAVIRLDANILSDGYQPPPGRYTAALLADAIGQAAAAVTLATSPPGPAIRLGFGDQTDARIIREGHPLAATGQALDAIAVASYIAKYATKTLTVPGLPDYRLRTMYDIRQLRCSAHYRRIITTCWDLASPGPHP